MQTLKQFTKKEKSWIMYDWANSIYATNIMAAIYPTIFASAFEGGDIIWGWGTSVATFLVAILAPFLGAIADHKGMKKKLFTAFALIGILFTPLMAFFGNLKLCMIGYVISRLGFSGSCLFYDSFLTDVTTDDRMDRVSSWGYAAGYIGGSTIPFIISIGMLLLFDYSHFAQVFSVLIVSAWWLVFSIPFLKNVKQEHYIEEKGAFNPVQIVKNVVGTFKEICRHKAILFFIIAYFFYIDGVDTVISISTAYGTTLGLGTTGMILALLVTQIVAVPCSIIFARLSEKFSARKALMGAVAVYIIICIVGFIMGYTVEPDQAAYKDMLKNGAAPYEERVENAQNGAYAAFLKEAEEAFKGSDAEMAFAEIKVFESEEHAELETEFKAAVLSHVTENQSVVDEFQSSLSISTILFWSMACLVGTVQGGIQAVSRSYFGKLVPKERSNEFFGFFDIFGKFSCVIGPALYALIAGATGYSCYGVLVLIVLFGLGLGTLILARKHLDSAVSAK